MSYYNASGYRIQEEVNPKRHFIIEFKNLEPKIHTIGRDYLESREEAKEVAEELLKKNQHWADDLALSEKLIEDSSFSKQNCKEEKINE